MSVAHIHDSRGIEIFHLENDISTLVIETINETLSPYVEDASISKILLNFQKVPFIDSLGIGALFTYCKKMKEHGARFVFCDVGEKIKHIMAVTGIDRHVEIYPTEEEAISEMLNP